MSKTEKNLRETLLKLEQSTQKLIETRGYTKDAAKMRLLEEMIREQLKNENPRNSTRTIR
jgi:hypothetical protein